jgi:hypothetical protein
MTSRPAALMLGLLAVGTVHAEEPPKQIEDQTAAGFRPDPNYADVAYDASAQWQIYGGKYANATQRPLLELGREMYGSGPFKPSRPTFGSTNISAQQFFVYGDVQVASGWNKLGDDDSTRLAARLNLDFDWRLTSTERFHAFSRPFDKDGQFLSYDYANSNAEFNDRLDGNLDTFFFEGDLAAMTAGWRGKRNKADVPFAIGLMPLLLQNGVWLEDAFTGVAFTIPAQNSRKLDISNMDVTLFAGVDRVSSTATAGRRDDPSILGLAMFIEANQGYWEFDYGYTHDKDGGANDRSYHNVGLAFTRRYGNWLSNSIRLIANVGQTEPVSGIKTADGGLLLIENSLITSKPSTLVPYINLFVGVDAPNSLARDPGAGGILKNTGLLFEGNALSGLPSMDASAHNTWGGAFGVEYLFNLDQQIVFELAALQTMGEPFERIAQDDQYGFGIRYQLKWRHNMIFRLDGMWADRGIEEDLAGLRAEWRMKF